MLELSHTQLYGCNVTVGAVVRYAGARDVSGVVCGVLMPREVGASGVQFGSQGVLLGAPFVGSPVPPLMSAFWQGLGLGAALIVAIGAQNAFVLRQGLRREHVFAVASVCVLCDATLIVLGVAGFGALVAQSPILTAFAAWGGATFLFVYGLRAFRAAFRGGVLEAEPERTLPHRAAFLGALAVSLLNPHVYLDTVVLLGGISSRFAGGARTLFGFGALTASCLWFYGLAYGATRLGPLFRRPLAWRVLDTGIGVVMWSIAASLVLETLCP